jgi:hypothetical protein
VIPRGQHSGQQLGPGLGPRVSIADVGSSRQEVVAAGWRRWHRLVVEAQDAHHPEWHPGQQGGAGDDHRSVAQVGSGSLALQRWGQQSLDVTEGQLGGARLS